MKQLYFPRLFWLIAVLFLLHQIYQKVLSSSTFPIIDAYFDPFACAVLGLFVIKRHFSILEKKPRRQLKCLEVVLVVLVLSVISEEVFPLLSSRFTRDFWDYWAFAFGGLVFVIWQKRDGGIKH
ncbi:MAG: hypothetical protein AAF738_02650 [Bacteroidota bacterium]